MEDSPLVSLLLIVATIAAPLVTERLRPGSIPSFSSLARNIAALPLAGRIAIYASAAVAIGTFLPWWSYPDYWLGTFGWWDTTAWRVHLTLSPLDAKFVFPLAVATGYLAYRNKILAASICMVACIAVLIATYTYLTGQVVYDDAYYDYIGIGWGFYFTAVSALVALAAMYVQLAARYPQLPQVRKRGSPPTEQGDHALDPESDAARPDRGARDG